MKQAPLTSKLLVFTALLVSTALTVPARAGARHECQALFIKGNRAEVAQRIGQDSAVEIEIGATASVIELLTTTDGTLRPVIGDEAYSIQLPEQLRRSLQDYVGPGNDPLSASWDLLSPTEKVAVLEAAAAHLTRDDFFRDRSVSGLIYRPVIQLTFTEKTRFLGRDYEAGTHRFSSRDIFGETKVEYMGPNRMSQNLGFELHVRSNLPADENFLTSRALQNALIGQHQNLHEHIVGPYPEVPVARKTLWSKLRLKLEDKGFLERRTSAAAQVAAFRATEFARRVMLYFDVQMIKRGIPMTELRGSDDSINFYRASPSDLVAFYLSILARLNDVVAGRASGMESEVNSKAGTVGLRTRHFYDGEVLGIEVRYLSGSLPMEETARALALVQNVMVSGKYFMSEQEAGAFLGWLSQKERSHQIPVARLPYGSDFNGILDNSRLTPQQKNLVKGAATENDFVKMLFHDWSQDPLFYDKSDRVEQIRKAQAHGIQLLVRGMSPTQVMQFFMKKSALAHDIEGIFLKDEQP